MDRLLMDDPIVTVGQTEADGTVVDVWIGPWPAQAASMHRGGRREGRLSVFEGCPQEWLQSVMNLWVLMADPTADLSQHATHDLVVKGYGLMPELVKKGES